MVRMPPWQSSLLWSLGAAISGLGLGLYLFRNRRKRCSSSTLAVSEATMLMLIQTATGWTKNHAQDWLRAHAINLNGEALDEASLKELVIAGVGKNLSNSTTPSAALSLPSWLSEAHHAPPSYAASNPTSPPLDKDMVHMLRRKYFCANQSVSYANSGPLMIVRGFGARLFDETGRSFLDTRNNVGHVGHSHPAVVCAVAAQVSLY